MTQIRRRFSDRLQCGALVLAAFAACSAKAPAPARMGATAGSLAADSGSVPDAGVIVEEPACAPDNPFCSQVMTAPSTTALPSMNCGSLPIDLEPAGVNIMLMVDGSASMMSHWPSVVTAITSLRENNPKAAFGMHVFWSDAVQTLDEIAAANNTVNNACTTEHDNLLELGAHSAKELVGFLGSAPMGGTVNGVYQVAPWSVR